jgi:hypothetical protein
MLPGRVGLVGRFVPALDDRAPITGSSPRRTLSAMIAPPPHATALVLVQPAAIDPRRAFDLLSNVGAEWLGEVSDSPRRGTRRYLSDLSFPVRERAPQLTFKKAAYVDLGEVRATAEGCVAEISWQSSSLAPLFPVFAGHLKIGPTELRLEGYYAPPGGGIGAALDRAFLNIAARGTARWFLERAAEALKAVSTATADVSTDLPHSAGSGDAGGSATSAGSAHRAGSSGSTGKSRSNSKARRPDPAGA